MERKTFVGFWNIDDSYPFDDPNVLQLLIHNFASTVTDNPHWEFDPQGPILQYGEDVETGRYVLWACDAVDVSPHNAVYMNHRAAIRDTLEATYVGS